MVKSQELNESLILVYVKTRGTMHNNIRIELIIVHLLVYNYRLSTVDRLNTRIVLESG